MSQPENKIDFPPELFGDTAPIGVPLTAPKRRISPLVVLVPVLIAAVVFGAIKLAPTLMPEYREMPAYRSIRHAMDRVPVERDHAMVDDPVYQPAAPVPPSRYFERDRTLDCTGEEIVCLGMATANPADALIRAVADIPPQKKGQRYWVRVTVEKVQN